MNNFELGDRLLGEAEEYYEEMLRAYERRSWNVVVRRAQEVVELSLKGLIKMMGIEYPREHDVGGVFEGVCREKGIEIEIETLDQIKRTSSRLARERVPAFYMEELYNEEQARRSKGRSGASPGNGKRTEEQMKGLVETI
ncbi:MAG: HEPN domain-containing protein [Anaerolineae bacterium]